MDLRELGGSTTSPTTPVCRSRPLTRRKTGHGPKAIRVGKHLRWRASVVLEWTLAREREN